MNKEHVAEVQLKCFHCGEDCNTDRISFDDKIFCCQGCKMVYQIINKNNLCEYYNLNDAPGINQRIEIRNDKFAFLDDEKIQNKLITFKDEHQLRATFYLPQMHCSSCLYLLENLHKFDAGIISSKVNFTRKELDLVLDTTVTNLRKAAEMLARIGYEPYISLNDLREKRPAINRTMIYQLGVAGFCFGNIMLMSFPEYLGVDVSEQGLRAIFRWANMFMAMPVLLYSALPFYQSSWKSLQHKFLNIDAPIALAIIITFIRSAYEVISGTGGGYFDSMTGIVFFMLAGRIIQNKTYRELSFERDYTSYFPLAVSILKNDKEMAKTLPEIKTGDTMLIHHEELIPADGILSKGKAFIDYSFVTGESLPVLKEVGEIVYAGGKQTEGNIEILVVKEVAQSYLTKLWDQSKRENEPDKKNTSFVHLLSRYFTYIVFSIAIATAVYWLIHDKTHLWTSVTSIFIIACPCALLLSNTFTNGNVLRILGRNHFYLRNSSTIEEIANINHIVFDKTGTLTEAQQQEISYEGKRLNEIQRMNISALARCSSHPLSRALAKHLGYTNLEVIHFKETTGLGIEAYINDSFIKIGSPEFIGAKKSDGNNSRVFIKIDNKMLGSFCFNNHYRNDIDSLIKELKKHYQLSLISGDNSAEKIKLRKILGESATILFNQKPEDKLRYIKHLQEKGNRVMMIGDGLNDAGALKQSNIGVAIAEQTNNFTPACDAIIEAKQLHRLNKFISICKANKKIVMASFVLSIVYNMIGLFFAVQGNLSPLIAAILMPSSSLSIVLITFGSSTLLAKKMKMI